MFIHQVEDQSNIFHYFNVSEFQREIGHVAVSNRTKSVVNILREVAKQAMSLFPIQWLT